MKSLTPHYTQPNPFKNFVLLCSGAIAFFFVVVLVEPVSYFSQHHKSVNNPQPEKSTPHVIKAAAAIITSAEYNNENKPGNKPDSAKAIFPPVKDIEKKALLSAMAKHAAIVKAGKTFLKDNNARNNAIVKELAQVTEMHEFHFKDGYSGFDQKSVMDKLDSSIQQYAVSPGSWNKIIILGFTDNRGSKLTNVKLGLKRAAKFKALLVQKGIPAEKITVASFGAELPIASNDDETGRARNRRVEINLLGNGG
ncbi:MAG: OmpA family protein [Chitinophagaceae bacterium]